MFADYYFEQFDDWHAGRIDQVSPAWRIAFHAADAQQVTGMGNVFLGMNAHVNRDLPFVLAEIGLVKPDGTSRKPTTTGSTTSSPPPTSTCCPRRPSTSTRPLDDGDVPGTSIDN